MNEITIQDIRTHIVHLPNRPPAMLAGRLADIYGVETRHINQAVSRNRNRFPDDFCFQTTDSEIDIMVSQNVIPNWQVFGGHLPWMFTRFGANQLSTILKSDVAAKRSVQIMRAFSMMEENRAGFHSADLPMEAMAKQIISLVTPVVIAEVLKQVLPKVQGVEDRIDNMRMQFGRLSSVSAFAQLCCEVGGRADVTPKEKIYNAYCEYCRATKSRQFTNSHFFMKVYQAIPDSRKTRITVDGQRIPAISGLVLMPGYRRMIVDLQRTGEKRAEQEMQRRRDLYCDLSPVAAKIKTTGEAN